MREKKKINWRFTKLEYKLIEEYLEEMATKGWMLEEINGKNAIFTPTQPRRLKFCVDITPYEDTNSENFEKNKSHCEKLGWHFIFSYDQMGFYYAEKNENTHAIHTDLEIEQQLVLDKIWKKEVFRSLGSIIYILLLAMIIYTFRRKFLNYIIFTNWILLALIPIGCIIAASAFISKIIWYFKVKENKGLNIKQNSFKYVKFRNSLLDLGDKIIFILSIVILVSGLFPRGLKYNLNTKVFVAVIVIFVVGACFLYLKYQGKINKKWQNVFIICIFIGITFFTYIMAQSSLKNDIENPKDIQVVPNKYPVIKISDFIDTDEIDSNYFTKSYNPIVPVNYKYEEYYSDASHTYMAETEYYKSFNEKIANMIYDGIIYDYSDDKFLKATIRNDSAIYWNADKASIISINILSDDILLLLKGKEVIKVNISENLANLHDEKFKELLSKKFMN